MSISFGTACKALTLGKRLLLWALQRWVKPRYEEAHARWVASRRRVWRPLRASLRYRLLSPSRWDRRPGAGGLASCEGAILEIENRGAPCAVRGVFIVRSETTGTVRVPFDTGAGVGPEVHRLVLPGFPVDDVYERAGRYFCDVETVTLEANVVDSCGASEHRDAWAPMHQEFLNRHLVERFGRTYNIAMFAHAKTELRIALQWALLAFPETPADWHGGRTLRWDSWLRRLLARVLTSEFGVDAVFWWLHLRGRLQFDEHAMVMTGWAWPGRIRGVIRLDRIDPFAARSLGSAS